MKMTARDGVILLFLCLFPGPAISGDTGPVCAIDMGSTNFKLMIGEIKARKYVQHQYLKDRLSVGDDVSHAHVITTPKLKQVRETLKKYLDVCGAQGISTRAAVATAAFREAKNRRDLFRIAQALNLPLEIASEERESQLAYLVGTLGKANFAVIDHGSRSVEFVTSNGRGYQWHVFNLGYRIAFDRFFRPARNFAEATDRYRQALVPHLVAADFMKNRDGYVGVEMQHLARTLLSLDRADDVSVPLDTVTKKIAALRTLTELDFRKLKNEEHIDAVLPRLVMLEQTLTTFGYKKMQVFERELGVGIIVEQSLQRN